MSKLLSKDQIFKVLRAKFADQNEKTIREISYNLCLANTTESSLEERARRALDKISASPMGATPLNQSAKSAQHGKLSICPICKMGMKTVKLLEGHPAYYCPDHRITVKFPKEDSEAE